MKEPTLKEKIFIINDILKDKEVEKLLDDIQIQWSLLSPDMQKEVDIEMRKRIKNK